MEVEDSQVEPDPYPVESDAYPMDSQPMDSLPMDSQPMDSEPMEEPDSQREEELSPGKGLELEGPTSGGEPGPVALGVSPTSGCPSTASTESLSMPPPPVPSKEAIEKKAEIRANVERKLKEIRPGFLPKSPLK